MREEERQTAASVTEHTLTTNSTQNKQTNKKTGQNKTKILTKQQHLLVVNLPQYFCKLNYLVMNFVTLIEICYRVLLYRPMTN